MAKKNVRELKVCAQSGYRYKDVPQIQLKGAWLREFGFTEGTPVTVACENGRLVITPRETAEESLPAATMVAEPKEKYGRRNAYV